MHFRQSLAAILAALACAPTLAQPSDAATVKAAATANNVAARYSPERLAAIDAEYLARRSLLLDVKILLATLVPGLRAP